MSEETHNLCLEETNKKALPQSALHNYGFAYRLSLVTGEVSSPLVSLEETNILARSYKGSEGARDAAILQAGVDYS